MIPAYITFFCQQLHQACKDKFGAESNPEQIALSFLFDEWLLKAACAEPNKHQLSNTIIDKNTYQNLMLVRIAVMELFDDDESFEHKKNVIPH